MTDKKQPDPNDTDVHLTIRPDFAGNFDPDKSAPGGYNLPVSSGDIKLPGETGDAEQDADVKKGGEADKAPEKDDKPPAVKSPPTPATGPKPEAPAEKGPAPKSPVASPAKGK